MRWMVCIYLQNLSQLWYNYYITSMRYNTTLPKERKYSEAQFLSNVYLEQESTNLHMKAHSIQYYSRLVGLVRHSHKCIHNSFWTSLYEISFHECYINLLFIHWSDLQKGGIHPLLDLSIVLPGQPIKPLLFTWCSMKALIKSYGYYIYKGVRSNKTCDQICKKS